MRRGEEGEEELGGERLRRKMRGMRRRGVKGRRMRRGGVRRMVKRKNMKKMRGGVKWKMRRGEM